jgi:hypothetical protein
MKERGLPLPVAVLGVHGEGRGGLCVNKNECHQ